ncbi:MAG: hypothetical protein ACD_12C00572G0001, partial [uncultured bacterium]
MDSYKNKKIKFRLTSSSRMGFNMAHTEGVGPWKICKQ